MVDKKEATPAPPAKKARGARKKAAATQPAPGPGFDGHAVTCSDCGEINLVGEGDFEELSLTVHTVERSSFPSRVPRPILSLYLRYVECSHCRAKIMLNTFTIY